MGTEFTLPVYCVERDLGGLYSFFWKKRVALSVPPFFGREHNFGILYCFLWENREIFLHLQREKGTGFGFKANCSSCFE